MYGSRNKLTRLLPCVFSGLPVRLIGCQRHPRRPRVNDAPSEDVYGWQRDTTLVLDDAQRESTEMAIFKEDAAEMCGNGMYSSLIAWSYSGPMIL